MVGQPLEKRKVSRGVDKISVDRSRRAREETEVDNRTSVLRLHKLKHCEVARKNVEMEIVRMADPSAYADMFDAGSFCAVRKGAFWEILPLPARGRFKKVQQPVFSLSVWVSFIASHSCTHLCRRPSKHPYVDLSQIKTGGRATVDFFVPS